MRKTIIGCIIFLGNITQGLYAQELFVLTEPASNMPKGSIGIRSMNSMMFQKNGKLNYHQMPELMWGIHQKWMLHIQSFASSRQNGGLVHEGFSIYNKFRFLSIDDFNSHFRLAAYHRISLNNAEIHQEEIETMGHNSGNEIGLIATQLINKNALNFTTSFEQIFSSQKNAILFNKGLNYTLSYGRLIYPKKYTHFKQTNINLMVELLGQNLLGSEKNFLDIAPSIQFIINSQMRIDIAYRAALYSNMSRTAPNGAILKFEYTFFNLKK